MERGFRELRELFQDPDEPIISDEDPVVPPDGPLGSEPSAHPDDATAAGLPMVADTIMDVDTGVNPEAGDDQGEDELSSKQPRTTVEL